MIEILLIIAFILYVLAFIFKPRKGILSCGLIGYSGVSNYNIDKIKFLMLWNSIERGRDATGIYTPSSGLAKDNEPASKFFTQKEMKQIVPDNQLIAHVRAKTVGANLARCAHPFDYENIVLAHNGTLTDYINLAKSYGLESKDYDVDSQILAYGVNRAFGEGVTADNLNIETLTEYKGAAAMLIYSKKLDCIYLFKDEYRPLCFAYDDEGNMYISSISEPLRALGLTEPLSFADNTLYCISQGKIVSRKIYATYEETHKSEYVGKVRKRGEKGQKFPKLKKGQRGLKAESSDFKSYHLLSLWLLCTRQTWAGKGSFEKNAILKKDRYYLVTGYYSDEAKVIQVKDENGDLGQAWISDFDLDNCIPQEGDLFRIASNVVTKKDDSQLYAKDEVALIVKYNIDFGTLDIWHDKNNREYEVNTDFGKCLTYEEAYDYLQAVEEKEGSVKEAEIIEETPFIDSLPEKQVDIVANFFDFEETSTDKDKESNLDDFISTKSFLGVLDILDNQVNGLEEDYSADMDLTPKINEIKSTLSSSKDKAYLDSLVEKVPN